MIKLKIPGDPKAADKVYSRWLELKALTEHSVYLSCLIELGSDLPDPNILMRFFGEKVSGVQLSVNTFISNQKGFPVLSKAHQIMVKQFMKIQARFVLQPRRNNDDLSKYYNYLTYMFKEHDTFDNDEKCNFNYRNYLQSPL